ncbi:hypothetical protein LTA6_002332 [Microbacterium sp. LTA6]|uniref:hypothetical protein n=1 Tax=Microbacterium sp. LTA6 TaxID=3129771 RepID=UPI00324F6523
MNELSFRQPRRTLILVLGLAYLVVVLTLMIINFDALAEIVNDMAAGGAKGTGMLVGAVVFIPLIALAAVSMQRVHLRRDADTLTVRIGSAEKHLRNGDIARYTVNTPRVGTIRLLAPDGSMLQEFNPRMQDYRRVLELVDHGGRYAEVERRTAFRGRVNVVTYERSPRPVSPPR